MIRFDFVRFSFAFVYPNLNHTYLILVCFFSSVCFSIDCFNLVQFGHLIFEFATKSVLFILKYAPLK